MTRPKKTCKLSWESGGPRTIAKQQLVKGKEKLSFDVIKDDLLTLIFRLRMDIDEIHVHPGYNPVLMDNDFALLK